MTLCKDFRKEIKTFNELKEVYDLRSINDYDYDFIEEHESVVKIENNGLSGRFENKSWFTAYDEHGNDFDFYMKRGEE